MVNIYTQSVSTKLSSVNLSVLVLFSFSKDAIIFKLGNECAARLLLAVSGGERICTSQITDQHNINMTDYEHQ